MKATHVGLAMGYAALLTFTAATQAADPMKGQTLSKQCTVCHGKIGIAKDPEVPNLAGQVSFLCREKP